MAVIESEKLSSRLSETGDSARVELLFDLFVEPEEGVENEVLVRRYLRDNSPGSVDYYGDGTLICWRNSIRIDEPLTPEHFTATVGYEPYAYQPTFEFNTAGGTRNIKQSFGTERYARDGEVATDFHSLIEVSGDPGEEEVNGVDVVIPVYQFQETYYFANQLVDGAYKRLLFYMTGKINEYEFKGFEPGELLFLGAVGRGRAGDVTEITYSFAAEPNIYAGQTEGGITIPAINIDGIEVPYKRGWDYLWVRTVRKFDALAKTTTIQPKAVYKELIYLTADFSLLNIGF